MSVTKKQRLGRGLESLIINGVISELDSAKQKETTPSSTETLQEISLKKIFPNQDQARRFFDDQSIKELSESIAEEGLLQPILVAPRPDGNFSIVAGERRFRATQLLGKETILAKIITADQRDCAIISLIENLQRESLNPIEEATGFLHLISEFGLTQEEVAQKIGKARATVANSIRLLNLEKEILHYLGQGKITVGHAKVLLGIEDSATRMLLTQKIIEEDLNVRQTERQTSILKSAKTTKVASNPRELSESLIKIKKQIAKQLAANVSLQHGSTKGKIVIEYSGERELIRIVQSMGII